MTIHVLMHNIKKYFISGVLTLVTCVSLHAKEAVYIADDAVVYGKEFAAFPSIRMACNLAFFRLPFRHEVKSQVQKSLYRRDNQETSP